MNQFAVEGQVFDCLSEVSGVDADELTRPSVIFDFMDSLSLLEAVVFLEDALDIEIPDERLSACEIVGDLVDLVSDIVSEKTSR